MTRNYTTTEWRALSASERAHELAKARELLMLSALNVPQHNGVRVLLHTIADYEERALSELLKSDKREVKP